MRNGATSSAPPAGQRWLSLGQASRALGITPGTLRRWADRGQILSFTTPGGHRRFSAAAIVALIPADRARRPALKGPGASSARIARAYRRVRPEVRTSSLPSWITRLSESERSSFRIRGNQLVDQLLSHLDAEGVEASGRLDDAVEQAAGYGADAAKGGASLSDAVEAFLRFRRPFIDELAGLARKRGLDTREATALLVDAENALDRLLVALMSGHASVAGS
jgi:excisionase family DNA binding protein